MDKKTIWWMFGVTKGGVYRGQIVELLKEMPRNANQIATSLEIDYKTVRHHLDMLEKNKFVTKVGRPVAMYFISDTFEEHYKEFIKIIEQIKKKNDAS